MSRPIVSITRKVGRFTAYFARNHLGLKLWAGIAALLFGYVGWSLQLNPKGDPMTLVDRVNILFKTMQLVTLQFPTSIDNDINWQLHLARFAVPLVAALATFHVLVGALTRPMRLAMMPQTSRHIIVCGAERLTQAAFETLAARHHDVVFVTSKIDAARRDTMEGQGLTVVEADPADPATFAAVNVRKASALFLTHEDDLRNLDTAMLALGAMGTRPVGMPPLIMAALIDSEPLARELDTALDDLSQRHGARFLRLSPEREGMRLELARYAPALLKGVAKMRSHLLVFGLCGHWQQVLMQLIQSAQDHPDQIPRLSLVLDEDEAEAFGTWTASQPDLALVADITVLDKAAEAAALEIWRTTGPAPHLVVVLQDGAEAVATALGLRRAGNAYGLEHQPILVRRNGPDVLIGRLGTLGTRHADLARIVAFGGLLRPETIERVLDCKDDELARALHTHYLDRERATPLGSTDAMAEWNRTPDNIRDANRCSMAHAPIMLAWAGLGMERTQSGGTHFQPDSELLEQFPRIEHRRWMAERMARGWRSGPERVDKRRIHDCLVPFEELSEVVRQKDRDAVSTVLAVLQKSGWQIRPATPRDD